MKVLKNLKARLEQGRDTGMRDFHSLGISYVTADGTRIENTSQSTKSVVSVLREIFTGGWISIPGGALEFDSSCDGFICDVMKLDLDVGR